jgi:cytochrome c-type biogenesis protein CcmH
MTRAIAFAALTALLAVPAAFASDRSDTGPLREKVERVASGLRCPVCQNLSVWDSPSPVAHGMRLRIRELARDGASDAEIEAYFVDRYGEWVLLSPPREGIGLAVWLAPGVLLLAGFAVAGAVVARWRRRTRELAGVEPAALAEARARLDELERGLSP